MIHIYISDDFIAKDTSKEVTKQHMSKDKKASWKINNHTKVINQKESINNNQASSYIVFHWVGDIYESDYSKGNETNEQSITWFIWYKI